MDKVAREGSGGGGGGGCGQASKSYSRDERREDGDLEGQQNLPGERLERAGCKGEAAGRLRCYMQALMGGCFFSSSSFL